MDTSNPLIEALASAPINTSDYVDRSFIDLSFDGVLMSDLGLVCVSDGDMLTQNMVPSFTVSSTTLPGGRSPIFWRPMMQSLDIKKNLATDSMTSRQYQKFKQLLQPGKVARLILGQRPFCYAVAMVKEVEQLQFIPFDSNATTKVTTEVNGTTVETAVNIATVIYKGSCSVTWTLIDNVWYGDTTIGQAEPYSKYSWITQSNLPWNKDSNYIYASTTGVKMSIKGNTACYADCVACGSAASRVKFKISFNFVKDETNILSISDSGLNFTGFKLGKATLKTDEDKTTVSVNSTSCLTINKPRFVEDLQYMYKNQSSFDASNPAEFLQLLHENWDGPQEFQEWAYDILNSSNSVDTALKTILKNITTMILTVDSRHRCMQLEVKVSTGNITWTENVEGVSNGNYITLDGVTDLSIDSLFYNTPIGIGVVTTGTAQPIINTATIQFLNEYN